MNKFLLVISSLFVSLGAAAQGNNTLMGGNDNGVQSIAERITKLEKKHDAFNVYVNFAGSVRAEHDSRTDEWTNSSIVCATVLTGRLQVGALTILLRLPIL